MVRILRLLLLVLAREVAADEGHCTSVLAAPTCSCRTATATTALGHRCEYNGALPDVPEGTEIVMRQVARACDFDGAITVGGTLSLGQSDTYAATSAHLRHSLFILVDHVNKRGGLRVGNNVAAV